MWWNKPPLDVWIAEELTVFKQCLNVFSTKINLKTPLPMVSQIDDTLVTNLVNEFRDVFNDTSDFKALT